MTIAAGFKCLDGVLLCADTQVTGADKAFRDKIVPYFDGRTHVAFAFSGDEDYARDAVEQCQERLDSDLENSCQSIKECIREVVANMSIQYRNHYPHAPEQKPELLVSISEPGEDPKLFRARDSVMPSVSDVAFLGCGAYLGEYISEAFFSGQYFVLEDALLPAIFALTAATNHDPYCGGHLQFYGIPEQKYHMSWFSRHNDALASIIRDFQQECGTVLLFMSGSRDERFKTVIEHLPNKLETLRSKLLSNEGYRRLLESMMRTSSEISQT